MYSTMKWLGLAFTLCGLISAAPSTVTCSTYVDTFDNYTTIVGAPELSPITYLGGLLYNGFDASQAMSGPSGTIPASSPNIASASVNQDLTKFGTPSLNAYGTLSIATTAIKYFAMVEFYYACVVSTNSVLVPTGCIIEVFGYDTSHKQVGSVSYAYAPENEVAYIMNRAILPIYYVGLENVTFAIAQGNIATATTILRIDNVTHINCK